MQKLILLILVLPFAASGAVQTKKTLKVRNLVVENQNKFKFEGREGLLVKFKGVRKEVFLPLEKQNQEESVLEALNRSEKEGAPLAIKMVRSGTDIIQYKGKKGTEVLALGADCRKTKTTESPRLFCNKGYFIESAELNRPVVEATLEEETATE